MQSLLKKGARYMVVQGLPVSGCLPLAMFLAPENDRDDLGCVKSANDQTGAHNAILQLSLTDLRRKYPDAVIVYVDYWNAYRAVMKAPSRSIIYMCVCGIIFATTPTKPILTNSTHSH